MGDPIHHSWQRFANRFWLPAALVGGLTLTASFIGLDLFVKASFEQVPDVEVTPPGELIVVLAGGRGRIQQALERIAAGTARRLLIIGAGPGVSKDSVIPAKDWPVGVSRDLVEVENQSLSTFENALKIREIVLSNRLREVTVATSFYHALRTRLILTRVLPRWTRLTVVGVGTENFQREGTWTHWLSMRIATAEGLKYVWFWMMLPRVL